MSADLERFAIYLQEQDRSPHTIAAYTQDVAAFFAWLNAKTGRELAPANVTVFDVRKYREHLLAAGRKPAGLNRRLASLRTFFAWAVATELATTNPATTVQGQGNEIGRGIDALRLRYGWLFEHHPHVHAELVHRIRVADHVADEEQVTGREPEPMRVVAIYRVVDNRIIVSSQ